MNPGQRAERLEHVGDRVRRLETLRHDRLAVIECAKQKIDPLPFRPLFVRPETEMTCDGVDGAGVSSGLLPHVQADEGEPERRDAPKHIRQAPVGDDPVARRVERSIAEAQRLGQRVGRLVHLGGRGDSLGGHRRGLGSLQPIPEPGARDLESMLDVPENRAVRLRNVPDARPQLRARVVHRELAAERFNLGRI